MPQTITTSHRATGDTGISTLLQDVVLARRFVEVLRANLVTLPLGLREDLPRMSGKTIRWSLFANPATATTALTEGVDPTDSLSIKTSVDTAVLLTYGDYFEITELLELTATNGTTQQFVDAAAYQASLTIDDLIMTACIATSTTQNAGTAMTADALLTGVRTLQGNNAKPNPATPGFFCGVLSTEAAYDMLGEGGPAWFQVKTDDLRASLTTPFANTPPTAALYGCIIKTSTNVVALTSEDLNLIFADSGFGITSLDSNLANPEIKRVPPSPSLASPLGLRGTIGWRIYFATKLIDPARVVRIDSDQT